MSISDLVKNRLHFDNKADQQSNRVQVRRMGPVKRGEQAMKSSEDCERLLFSPSSRYHNKHLHNYSMGRDKFPIVRYGAIDPDDSQEDHIRSRMGSGFSIPDAVSMPRVVERAVSSSSIISPDIE